MRRSSHQHQVARTSASAWSAAATHRGTPAAPRLSTKSITSRASVPSSDLRGSSMRACRRSIRATAASRSATVILGGVLTCQIFTDVSGSTVRAAPSSVDQEAPVVSDTRSRRIAGGPKQLHRGRPAARTVRPGRPQQPGRRRPRPRYRPPRGGSSLPRRPEAPLPRAALGIRRVQSPGRPLPRPAREAAASTAHAAGPGGRAPGSRVATPRTGGDSLLLATPLALDPGHASGPTSPATASTPGRPVQASRSMSTIRATRPPVTLGRPCMAKGRAATSAAARPSDRLLASPN